MAKQKDELVRCRYPQCTKIHKSTELKKEDAVQGGKNFYYHPDCWHIMKTVIKIRDLFYEEINPLMTGRQISTLVAAVNNLVFVKNVNVDYVLFSLEYFIKYKPGKLHNPNGIYYIVQDKDVKAAWEKEQDRKLRDELRSQMEKAAQKNENEESVKFNLDLPEDEFVYKPQKQKRFSNVLGV